MNFFKRTLILATLGLATFGVSSCEQFTEDRDVNPNIPQDAPAAQQLRAAEVAEGYVFTGNLARVAGMWSGYFTGVDRQYSSLDQYITSAGDYDNEWGLTFETTAAQARIVTNKALAVNNFQLAGISQVVEANVIGTATSLWGDIPYSENFRVQTVSDNRSPKFDSQVSVYAQVDALLVKAIENLGKSGASPGSLDIFYGGDSEKWTAAAHSLRARYMLHQKKYAEALTEAQQGISDASGDLIMPYFGVAPGGDLNPYYDFIDYSRSGYMTADGAYAVGLLDSVRANDKTEETSRYEVYYTYNGDYGAPDPNYISSYDPRSARYTRQTGGVQGAFAAESGHPLMTAVETSLIIAECQARVGSATGALSALNQARGINSETFPYRGTDTTRTEAYVAYTAEDFQAGGIVNGGLSEGDALLKEILTEKYLSLIGQIETFNDIRRTNNLVGVPKKSNTTPDMPQRFLIAQSEVNTNVNVPKPIPGLFVKTAVNQ